MGWRALGDAAWLYEAGGSGLASPSVRVRELRRRLEASVIPEVTDLVASFDSLAVHFQPENGGTVLNWLTTQPPPVEGGTLSEGELVEIPVIYGGDCGPDLETVAAALGRSVDEVVRLHRKAEYTVAAVGFSPGFPYLSGLPPELRLPRVETPHKVAAGSVAIAGDQAGVYPFDSPGGWHVLGRTPLSLFDPSRVEPALLRPGDRVRFVPVLRMKATAAPEKDRNSLTKFGDIEVLAAGAFTTVQDLGRPGYQNIGVSPGGAADPVAARVANRLVGNPDDAAVLECAMQGPLLRFSKETRVAFTGWADERSGMPIVIRGGGELDLRTRMRSVRGYVAVAGGIDVPPVLGSRCTDVRAGFGGLQGRALKAGDMLATGISAGGPIPGAWRVGWPSSAEGKPIELRFLAGMQAGWFPYDIRERFRDSIYQISRESDRTGARLEGPRLGCNDSGAMVSQPVVAGSVQVPPDGRPIILLAERQTIGGYPQIGHVISADLPKLARAWPDTAVKFREVDLEEARAAWRELRRDLDFLQSGLHFLR